MIRFHWLGENGFVSSYFTFRTTGFVVIIPYGSPEDAAKGLFWAVAAVGDESFFACRHIYIPDIIIH
jgi:hypothetical protein